MRFRRSPWRGYTPASSRSVRDWLEKCHDEKRVERAREEAAELDLKASVPEPTTGQLALQTILGVSAREAAARLPEGAPCVATVDLDATVVESAKRAAYWTYTGVKGYQPVVAVWAELNYVPGRKTENKDTRPRRYIGLRFIKPQGDLFEDGHDRTSPLQMPFRPPRAQLSQSEVCQSTLTFPPPPPHNRPCM